MMKRLFPLSMPDRILRSCFVALAVGLGWSIRGDFGGSLGASYPGIMLMLAFAYVSGDTRLFLRMPVLCAVSGLGIGLGGAMSYGVLHGYAQADTPVNYAYGFLTLFLQGGAWGVFGCAAVGLLLERERVKALQWCEFFGVIIAGAVVFHLLVVNLIGFHVNPPRGDTSVGFVGGAIALFAWLAWRGKQTGLRAALLGFIGFGLGMSLGRLFGNIAHVAQEAGGFTINHWNVMENSVGLIGGFIFTFGMLGVPVPERPGNRDLTPGRVLGVLYALGLTPLLHLLTRIQPKAIKASAEAFASYGYADPEGMARWTQHLMIAVIVAGFAAAAVWIYLLYQREADYAWFPAIALSAVMLLFQNLNARFFYYPHEPNSVNMHALMWVFLLLMAAYAAVRHSMYPHDEPAPMESPAAPWRRWALSAVAAYALIVLAAGFVNGPVTMRCACTRWPVWSWQDEKPAAPAENPTSQAH